MAKMHEDDIRENVDSIVEDIERLVEDSEPGTTDEEDGTRIRVALVEQLLLTDPGVREHFSDALIGELKEEISRDDTAFAYACRNAIMEVEQRWRNA